MNYYDILGIRKDSNEQVISIAYREILKKYEQSNNAEQLEKLNEINDAYLVLINPKKRAEYDKNGFVVEEVKEEKKPQPPKKRWQNFWYYNKWYTYASIFILIVLIVSIRSCVIRINPDLQILFLTSASLSDQDLNILENNISAYVDDITNNKKVEVEISNLPIGGNSNNQLTMAMNQKFVAEVSLGDTIFYMCDKDSVKKFTENNLLSNISDISKNTPEFDGTLIKLSNPKIYEGLSAYAPKELYIGIRAYNKADIEKDKAKKQKYERVIEIIKKMQ